MKPSNLPEMDASARFCLPSYPLPSTDFSQAMVHEDVVPPTMTIVLAMGPKLMVKSAVERNLPAKDRKDYTSNEVSQLCADAVQVIMRSGVLYDEVIIAFWFLGPGGGSCCVW